MEKSKITINRKANGTMKFNEVFIGFDKVKAITETFGGKAEDELKRLNVTIHEMSWGYMWFDAKTGALNVSSNYLENGNPVDIYLDVVHELVHLKQSRDGRDLLDPNYNYVDRPTEIEAYRVSVDEARQLGLNRREIVRYLRVPLVERGQIERLVRAVGI